MKIVFQFGKRLVSHAKYLLGELPTSDTKVWDLTAQDKQT